MMRKGVHIIVHLFFCFPNFPVLFFGQELYRSVSVMYNVGILAVVYENNALEEVCTHLNASAVFGI